jgi:ubiquitin carboxyl-terminal hydrolase 22/27/51
MSELAKGCEHFLEYRQNHGLQSFKIIYKYLVKPGQEARKLKAKTCLCHVCHCFTPRLHTCLMCVYFGCMNPDNHMKVHVKSAGHPLAVDLNYGTVFCFKCRDYTYDASLDEICRETDQQLAHKKYHISRQPVAYVAWEPTKSEMELLKQNPKRRRVEPNSTVGLRGLYNLGNTCFMNCIVQALAHTPILRDYFLSDRHRCFLDTMQQRCVVCEMGNLFQEFYSGVSCPYIPFKLLHLVWTHARHLAGYEQQDAHEFFIAVLDVLHHHSGGQTPTVTQPGHCSCIVDQTYNGRLQSDVQCQTCKSVSTTVDPFRDISLDLAPSMVTNRTSTPVETNDIQSDRASPASSTNSGETLLSAVPTTLYECLDRFTRPESLGSESKIKCNQCHSYQESTKKLSIKKLPIVTCFHLKRFEHSLRSRKIANYIQFDLEIDLTSYMARIRWFGVSVLQRRSSQLLRIGNENFPRQITVF